VSQSEFNNLNISTKLDTLTKTDLIQKYSNLEIQYFELQKEILRLKNQHLTDAQLNLLLSEQLSEAKNTIFGSSSERYIKPELNKVKKEIPQPHVKKPSERYPNVPVREDKIVFASIPECESCGKPMTDSGMFEESEQLNVIPKKFEIIKFLRPKYRCSCQACLKTAPLPKRIIDGSSYSDDMVIDVVCSKYCDLIPIERYVQMAGRGGLIGLPPQSLIELTHQFANFTKPVYELIKKEIQNSRVLHADETPHNMMEGSSTKSWYLWGFSTLRNCYLDCRDTRSGDIASEVLQNSVCEVIISDDFGGYQKSVKFVNENRQLNNQKLITNAKCNAHARRYFFKPRINYSECEFYLENYHQIYRLNAESKDKPPEEILKYRQKMRIYFEAMKSRALEECHSNKYSDKSKFITALNYFLKNYVELILFLDQPDVAIDNNAQERLLRSHVVGRKTWYGTHSARGAETAAILFSIIETCKLNKINPREYLKNLVLDLHNGKNPYTPSESKDLAKI
jgi:transposase